MGSGKNTLFFILSLFATFSVVHSNDLKELEEKIAAEEAGFQGLKKDVQKQFTWSNPNVPQKTEYAFVYLHGFTATRDEAGDLVKRWSQILGANTFSTRFSGHGFEDVDHLRVPTTLDWEKDAHEAINYGKQIGEKVIVVAKSTGATVGMLSVHKAPEQIDRLLLLSPNFGVNRTLSQILKIPGGLDLLKLFVGSHYKYANMNKEESRIWYPHFPMDAVTTVRNVVNKLKKLDWSKELPPLMTVYDPKDLTVDPGEILKHHRMIRSPEKELQAFETDENHVLYNPATERGKANEQRIFELTTEFVIKSSGLRCKDIFSSSPI